MVKGTLFIVMLTVAAHAMAEDGEQAQSDEQDLAEITTPQLQRQLFSIESELEQRGISAEKKRKRLQESTSRIKKLMTSKTAKNAVVGGVIAAAVTAHPAGFIIGGLAGGMVGKSKRYDEAEEALAEIEQQIIVDEDDFLTEGEVRLAAFSGEADELSRDQVDEQLMAKYQLDDQLKEDQPEQMMASQQAGRPQSEPQSSSLYTDNGSGFKSEKSPQEVDYQYQQVAVANALDAQPEPSKPTERKLQPLASCYETQEGERLTREQMPHCFYMMY